MSYTDEQLKYINYDKKKHTKLLACAGSGKTRCIIARINRLLENKIYESGEILMLTFSRFTRDDFLNKIKSYNGSYIPANCVKTIDSFAKQIIDPDGTMDVSLLSFKFMKFLENETTTNLKKNVILKKVKMVFIDEAQDLNEIQYNIFCHLRTKLKTIINMVGDPNQNIYQFRNSSDKYLTQFDGIVFTLTKNFRSHLQIVDFSKHLRPFNEYDVVCTKGPNNCRPIIMFYEDEKIIEEYIIDLLNMATEKGIDLSEFAILSPVRGRMRGGGKSHGLCLLSNVLYRANIKFKQFYEESVDEVSCEGVKYEPVKGHINLLTYMGSKGLEWNYVIIIDADACLINKRYFNEEKHKHDQYLLYVACSRAIQNMYIFSKCYFRSGVPCFHTNPWFSNIPFNLYQIDSRFAKYFAFQELKYVDFSEKDVRLSKIIDKFDCYELDEISNLLDYQNKKIKFKHKIFKQDYSSIEKHSAMFLAKYTENLFYALYNIKTGKKHITYQAIENIIDTDNLVSGMPDDVTKWYYQNRKNMTWDKFDKDTKIPNNVRDNINSYFDRTKNFDSHTVSLNGYYQWFILDQKTWIKNLYKKYIKCKNTSQIREILFYLMIIVHGIDTQHYFHIKSKGVQYSHILNDFKHMFDEIEEYVEEMDHNFIASNESVYRWEIVSMIDLVDENENIWTLKCSNDISLKHILHSIIDTLIYKQNLIGDDYKILDNFELVQTIDQVTKFSTDTLSIDVNFINFMKGEEISYCFELSQDNINKLMNIIIKNIHSSSGHIQQNSLDPINPIIDNDNQIDYFNIDDSTCNNKNINEKTHIQILEAKNH